jgi:hypothetical protein
MADVSIDKTDPQIKHIRPITDDLLTKFQLERPVILAYKVTTPELPFTIQIIAQSADKTYVYLPYTITSITGIWYYKYEDIMDDKQRFVRESRMVKGDAITQYTVGTSAIVFPVALSSRKLWIEGIGKADGYIEASESSLDAIGDFKIRRLNVYSESRQRVIPDSGSQETSISGSALRIRKISESVSGDSDENEWNNGSCGCGEKWSPDRGYDRWNYSAYETRYAIESAWTGEAVFSLIGNWRNEERMLMTERWDCCFPCSPRNDVYEGKLTATLTWKNSFNDGYLSDSVQSMYDPNKWIAFYTSVEERRVRQLDTTGHAEIWIGLSCFWWGGEACYTTDEIITDTQTNNVTMNVCGTENIVKTGHSHWNYFWHNKNGNLCGGEIDENGETTESEYFYLYKKYLKCQDKDFSGNQQNSILGGCWWQRVISDGERSTWSMENGPNVLLYDTQLVQKNWGQPFDDVTLGQGTIKGCTTMFELTYVRI